MNCPTILAQGFKLQNRSGLFALGIGAGDVIEGSNASRLTLSTTAPLYKQATAATASHVRLFPVSTSRYIRFSRGFVYIMGLSATVTNFDWKAVEAPGMGFYYQNTAGNRIGYDSVANRLTIVGPTSTLLAIFTPSNYLTHNKVIRLITFVITFHCTEDTTKWTQLHGFY
jgi:hypothetical protein